MRFLIKFTAAEKRTILFVLLYRFLKSALTYIYVNLKAGNPVILFRKLNFFCVTDLNFEEQFQPAFVSQTNMLKFKNCRKFWYELKLCIKKIISCDTVPLKRHSVAFRIAKSNMELLQFVKIFYSLEFVHSIGQEFTLAVSEINFLFVASADNIYTVYPVYIYLNYIYTTENSSFVQTVFNMEVRNNVCS